MYRLDTGGYEGDAEEDKASARPCPAPVRHIFRVAHLFSGSRRKFDIEWWLRILAQTHAFDVDVISVDVAVSPSVGCHPLPPTPG